ncbi:MAG: transglycosylase domain-containing protein [Proteobacteria bacterium]|nr:transglycosylase domain-containing protein [Pseudomonadota bacterium]
MNFLFRNLFLLKEFLKSITLKSWIVGSFLGVVFFGSGFLLERIAEGLVISEVRKKMLSFEKSYGINLSCQLIEFSWATLNLIDVSVGDQGEAVLDKVSVSLQYNPFSENFLKPSRVFIGQIYLKDSVSRKNRLELLSSVYRTLTQRGVSENSDNHSRKSWIPAEVQVQAGTLILSDGIDEHTKVSGLSFRALLRDRSIRWQASQVRILPLGGEDFVEGQVSFKNSALVIAKLRSRTNFKGTPLWSLVCTYSKADFFGTCEVNAKRVPNGLLAEFQRRLGSSFSPGIVGTISAKRTTAELVKLTFDGDILGTIVEHKVLSTGAVGPFDFGLRLTADLNLQTREVSSHDMKIAFPVRSNPDKSVGLDVDFNFKQTALDGKLSLNGQIHVQLMQAPCNEVLGALPLGLAPDLTGFQLRGVITGGGFLQLEGDRTDFTWGKTNIGCEVSAQPEIYTQEYLNGPFIVERFHGPDQVIQIPVDPSKRNYVPLKDIPAHVVATFVSSEDAGFWHHHGIEPGAIEQALERNAKEGRAAVGGSTITMQTVKNLFLSRDKTMARKAQEIFLAWHLERVIGKRRILEIYFNIAEFGPGLYGIGPASQRFFGVHPDKLSLKQGAYLASLLPAPIPRYQYYCRGALTENYQNLVGGILQRMLSLGRISAEEQAKGNSEVLVFQGAERDDSCLARLNFAGKVPADSD